MRRLAKHDAERKRGQVMLEYVVTLAVFVVLFGMCAFLLHAFRSYGGRVLSLIASN